MMISQPRRATAAIPNPWPALSKAGVVTPEVPGPVGAVLQGQAREDMLASLRRLENQGVHFHERQSRFIFEPAYPEVPPERALLLLEGNPADLGLSRPEAHQSVHAPSLIELKMLDVELAGGPELLEGDERMLWDAGTSLKQAGFSLNYYYSSTTLSDAVSRLSRGQEIRVKSGDRELLADSVSDLAAADYFYGSGQTRPQLERPEEAARLRRAEREGLCFLSGDDRVSAYSLHVRGHSPMAVSLKDGLALEIEPHELDDPERLRTKLAELDAVAERVLKPAGLDLTYFPLFNPRFSPDVQAGVVAELKRASPSDNWESLAEELAQSCQTDYELASKAVAVGRVLRKEGAREAHRCVAEMVGLNRLPADQAELFTRLTTAVGSFSASLQAFDLVRLPVAGEKPEDRAAALLRLVSSRPRSQADEGVELYRSVLAERDPQETLVATEGRLRRLLAGLPPDQPSTLARQAFRFLQDELRGGRLTTQRADELADSFASSLVLHGDPAQALALLSERAATASSVEQREDVVLVGGVRVRRKG